MVCRIAFDGVSLARVFSEEATASKKQLAVATGARQRQAAFFSGEGDAVSLSALRVVKTKKRVGGVERFVFENDQNCTCASGANCQARAKTVIAKNLFSDAAHARHFEGFEALLLATPTDQKASSSAPETSEADGTLYSTRREWKLRVVGAFGGKGKCVLEFKTPLGCTDTGVPGGLASSASFSVALIYCKDALDKSLPLFQV